MSRRSKSNLQPNHRKKEFVKDLKYKDDSKKKAAKDKKKEEKDDEKSETTTLSEKTEDMSVQQEKSEQSDKPGPGKPPSKLAASSTKETKPLESAPDWILSKEEKKRQRELKKKQEIGLDLPLSHFYDRKRGIERLINPDDEDNLNRKIENM